MGYFYFFGAIVGFSAIIAATAIFLHCLRRKKAVKSIISKGQTTPDDFFLTGYHQRTNLSLGQWVFIAVNAERILVFAEFMTGTIRADYDVFEIRRENIKEIVQTGSSKKLVVNIVTDKDILSQRSGYAAHEFWLRVKPYSKSADINSAISLFSLFK